MPTDDQKVEIDLGQGIDQKSHPFQVLGSSMADLRNRVFSKAKAISKDLGFDRLSRTTSTSGALASNKHSSTFNNELLAVDYDSSLTTGQTKLYSYSENEAKFFSRGTMPMGQSSFYLSNGSSFNENCCDSLVIGNYLLLLSARPTKGLFLSVIDTTSKSFLYRDIVVYNPTNPTVNVAKLVQVDTTTVGIYFTHLTNIFYSTWSTAALSTVAAFGTLATDLDKNTSTLDAQRVGTDSILAYPKVGPSIVLCKLSTSGTISSSATIATASSPIAVSVVIDSAGGNIFVGFVDVLNGARYFVRSLSALTNVLSETNIGFVIALGGGYAAISGVATASGAVTFFATLDAHGTTAKHYYTLRATATSGGSVAKSLFHSRAVIVARPVLYNNVVYALLNSFSDTQPSLFWVEDAGAIGPNNPIHAKFLEGLAEDMNDLTLHPYTKNSSQLSSGVFVTSHLKLIEVVTSNTTFDNFSQSVLFQHDFTQAQNRQSIQVNGATYFTGGQNTYYDGAQVVEMGFDQAPEGYAVRFSGISTASKYAVAVTQQGNAGLPEIFTITINTPGDQIEAGQYMKFSVASPATTGYLWYRINSVGTDPLAAVSGVPVDILSTDSRYQVAEKTAKALTSSSLGFTVSLTNNVITVTGNGNGNVTDAANFNVARGDLNGTYQYRAVYEWISSTGEIERSEPVVLKTALDDSQSTTMFVNVGSHIDLTMYYYTLTRKFRTSDLSNVSIKIYRNATLGTNFYLVTSTIEPLENSLTTLATSFTATFSDTLSDAAILSREALYTTGGVLESSPVPPAKAFVQAKNRLWLIDQVNDQLAYSKQIVQGEVVQFPAEFILSPDAKADIITGLAEMDEKVIFFKQNQPFYVVGDGPNDLGQGSFTLPEPILSPVGCTETSSVAKSQIGIFFKSQKGFYLLDRGLNANFIGAQVEDLKSATTLSAHLLPDRAQVRFLTANYVLIYDYDANQWSRRDITTIGTGTSATLWKNIYVIGQSTGFLWSQSTTSYRDNSTNVLTSFKTGWIHVAALQGYQRTKRAILLGQYKSAHKVTVNVFYNYAQAATDTYTFTPTLNAGDPIQFEIHLKTQKCEAVQFEVLEDATAGGGVLDEGNVWTNLLLWVGIKRGLNKLPASKRV